MIKNDHRVLEQLFAQLKSGEGDRRALLDEVEARLTAHARAEEGEVYPVIAQAAVPWKTLVLAIGRSAL
jgi:hemerythrin superfamily protein